MTVQTEARIYGSIDIAAKSSSNRMDIKPFNGVIRCGVAARAKFHELSLTIDPVIRFVRGSHSIKILQKTSRLCSFFFFVGAIHGRQEKRECVIQTAFFFFFFFFLFFFHLEATITTYRPIRGRLFFFQRSVLHTIVAHCQYTI